MFVNKIAHASTRQGAAPEGTPRMLRLFSKIHTLKKYFLYFITHILFYSIIFLNYL
jgi:hypothetical protein